MPILRANETILESFLQQLASHRSSGDEDDDEDDDEDASSSFDPSPAPARSSRTPSAPYLHAHHNFSPSLALPPRRRSLGVETPSFSPIHPRPSLGVLFRLTLREISFKFGRELGIGRRRRPRGRTSALPRLSQTWKWLSPALSRSALSFSSSSSSSSSFSRSTSSFASCSPSSSSCHESTPPHHVPPAPYPPRSSSQPHPSLSTFLVPLSQPLSARRLGRSDAKDRVRRRVVRVVRMVRVARGREERVVMVVVMVVPDQRG
jgi:hypothetical protein